MENPGLRYPRNCSDKPNHLLSENDMNAAPSSAQQFTAIGKSLTRSNDGGRKAISNFKKAQLIDANHAEAIINLASLTSMFAISSPEYAVALKYIEWANVIAPRNAQITHFRGLFQRNMGRKDLALTAFVSASSIRPDWFKAAHTAATTATELGEYSIARTHIERCLNIDPGHKELLSVKRELERKGASKNRQTISRFPETLHEMADFTSAISTHLLDKLTFPRVLSPSSKIFAAGSCFASNIAKVLNEQGYTAIANNFGETVNSTLANREYFEWLCADEPYESELSKGLSRCPR